MELEEVEEYVEVESEVEEEEVVEVEVIVVNVACAGLGYQPIHQAACAATAVIMTCVLNVSSRHLLHHQHLNQPLLPAASLTLIRAVSSLIPAVFGMGFRETFLSFAAKQESTLCTLHQRWSTAPAA